MTDIQSLLQWPDMVVTQDVDAMLAAQLVCWGNVAMGCTPPDNFVEWLDEVSKVTGAYTATECNARADAILFERKRSAQ